uniref:Olfactory receptor n=1 Tax=Leptobrachium leishanense TaxID=445787 RepID=A0A8C5WKR0_9ANUR
MNAVRVDMDWLNHTKVTYFIFSEISDDPQLVILIFLLVLLLYLTSLGGNMTILLLICLDRHLHTPMYFFLANLSVLDMSSATVALLNIILMFVTANRTIPYVTCITQMYFFGSFINVELLILTAMSYDRYVAICDPLRYILIMNHKICFLLALACWTLSLLEVLPLAVLLVELTCYRSNVINHFVCDIMPLIQLSCSDTFLLEAFFFIEGVFVMGFIPFLLTFTSYVFIIVAILRIRSSTGRRKAFYTCSSHLTVVLLLYSTLVFHQYLRPASANSLVSNKLFSLFNTAAIPLLNPLICSLRNNDVKSVLGKRLKCFKMEL